MQVGKEEILVDIMKTSKTIILTVLAWIAIVLISFFWNYFNARNEQERIAIQSARSFFDHIVITRLWNARHGGLYAPITSETKPNPYLVTPARDIKVSDELELTLVNPAFMTRQISEIALEQEGVQFHISSLKPIRPQNEPTEREKEFLAAFEKGTSEKGMFITEGGRKYYFYMAPLLTEKACLKCHADQGYRVGDVRGGISITTPYFMRIAIAPLIWGHLAIGLVGFLGIIFAGIRLSNAYEIIKDQAVCDSLTGIPNRRSYTESILREFKQSKRAKQPLAVIMCDIDNFKAYNDIYGHSSGDQCLQKVAEILKTSILRPADFCARYGGEEFVVLLPNTPSAGAKHVAERIRAQVEEAGIPHPKSLPAKIVTLSLGVSISTDQTSSHEELVNAADAALYEAKSQGRNQVRLPG